MGYYPALRQELSNRSSKKSYAPKAGTAAGLRSGRAQKLSCVQFVPNPESPPCADAAVRARFSDSKSAHAALRIPTHQQNKSPTAFAMRLFVLASPGGPGKLSMTRTVIFLDISDSFQKNVCLEFSTNQIKEFLYLKNYFNLVEWCSKIIFYSHFLQL